MANLQEAGDIKTMILQYIGNHPLACMLPIATESSSRFLIQAGGHGLT